MAKTRTLFCECGEHEWTRESQRGRLPRCCPLHTENPLQKGAQNRSIAPEAAPPAQAPEDTELSRQEISAALEAEGPWVAPAPRLTKKLAVRPDEDAMIFVGKKKLPAWRRVVTRFGSLEIGTMDGRHWWIEGLDGRAIIVRHEKGGYGRRYTVWTTDGQPHEIHRFETDWHAEGGVQFMMARWGIEEGRLTPRPWSPPTNATRRPLA